MMFDLADRIILNLPGERSFGNNIGEIDLAHLSTAEPDKFDDLNVLVALFYSGFVATSEGGLVGLPKEKK